MTKVTALTLGIVLLTSTDEPVKRQKLWSAAYSVALSRKMFSSSDRSFTQSATGCGPRQILKCTWFCVWEGGYGLKAKGPGYSHPGTECQD
eukprot:112389-Chlamydomonas_euryale.AAC.3